jgi:hypothetical protein
MVLFYVPNMKPESAPAGVPEYVAFFPSGLSAGDAGRRALSPEAEAATKAVLAALPLSPPEARAALDELQRMGLEYSSRGLLRPTALYEEYAEEEAEDAGEGAALDCFASSGELPRAGDADEARSARQARIARKHRVDAQKILILADYLEEKNLESAELEKSVLAAEQALRASLSEGGTPCRVSPDAAAHDFPRVAPKTLLRAVRHFLPADAALFTANDDLTAELMEDGLLKPLPADRAELAAFLPERERTGLLYARLPALAPTDGGLHPDHAPAAAIPALMRETELLARPGVLRRTDEDAGHA